MLRIFILTALLPLTAFAQFTPTDTCGVLSIGETFIPDKNITGRQSNQTLIVPVVFHVILTSTQMPTISDADVLTALNNLNDRFQRLNSQSNVRALFAPVIGNPRIHFCLANISPDGSPTTGINRRIIDNKPPSSAAGEIGFRYSAITGFPAELNAMKMSLWGIPPYNVLEYMNVWIVDIIGSGVAGYAYLPSVSVIGAWFDGIVVDYTTGFKFSQTILTHEAGHYFGLPHTWGTGQCTTDDGFEDTPLTSSANWSCVLTGSFVRNSCIESLPHPVYSMTEPVDQIENFMDYASCATMFTIEQSSHMRAILQGPRSQLLQSMGCAQTLNISGLDLRGSVQGNLVKLSWDWIGAPVGWWEIDRSQNGVEWEKAGGTTGTSFSERRASGLWCYRIYGGGQVRLVSVQVAPTSGIKVEEFMNKRGWWWVD